MNIKLVECSRVKKILTLVDRLFLLISAIVIPILIAVAFVWLVQKPPTQIFNTNIYIESKPGEIITIPSDIKIHIPAKKAVYRYWITNDKGYVLHRYPDVRIDEEHINFDTTLKIPSLQKGNYILHAEVIYPFNPFKNGYITFVLLTLRIN